MGPSRALPGSDGAGAALAPSPGVTNGQFIDHYEVLQVSQSADAETIDRVYRLLAKRYHPDNAASGDPEQFNALRMSYDVLANPERRAQYDVTYDEEKGQQWRIFDQGSAGDGREQDRRVFHGVLSLLYVARRRDPESGGLGAVHLERMLGVPREHLEFPLWYLKRRGWIESLTGGQLAITVDGVDVLGSKELSLPHDRLLSESTVVTSPPPPAESSLADRSSTVSNAEARLVPANNR